MNMLDSQDRQLVGNSIYWTSVGGEGSNSPERSREQDSNTTRSSASCPRAGIVNVSAPATTASVSIQIDEGMHGSRLGPVANMTHVPENPFSHTGEPREVSPLASTTAIKDFGEGGRANFQQSIGLSSLNQVGNNLNHRGRDFEEMQKYANKVYHY